VIIVLEEIKKRLKDVADIEDDSDHPVREKLVKEKLIKK
jgi:hypothetical protein